MKSLAYATLTTAGPPLDENLLVEGNGGVVVAQLPAGPAVGARERDAVVGVKDALGAARRPHYRRILHGVGLLVDLAAEVVGPGDCGARRGRVARVLREVVGAEEGAGDAGVEAGVAVVGGGHEGVLEAAWVCGGVS
jgi:hypothetical protein